MPPVTQPLRDEHKELLPLREQVKTAADAVDQGSGVTEALDRAYEFLAAHLLPHAVTEEIALYPELTHQANSHGGELLLRPGPEG